MLSIYKDFLLFFRALETKFSYGRLSAGIEPPGMILHNIHRIPSDGQISIYMKI